MFSIVIPLYNKEKQIAKTIESVFNQTFQEYEIVIVNDGSTDDSVEIVNQINDKRIKLINQQNGGVSSARNTGIKNASFEYVAFLDADDEWLVDYLETIFNMIKNYPECSVFATNYKIIDTKGQERFPVDVNLAKFSKTKGGKDGILIDYFNFASRTAPPLWTSAIVCKRTTIKNIGCFPKGIRMGEDLIVWAKLASNYKVCYSKNIKSIYHFKSYDELLDDEPLPDEIDYVGSELLNLKKINQSKFLDDYISLWYKMRTTMYIANFLRKDAICEAIKMLKFNPFKFKNILIFCLCLIPHSLRMFMSKIILKNKR